jgi:hypothetical protein
MITITRTPKAARALQFRHFKSVPSPRSLAHVASPTFEAPLSRFEKDQSVNYSDFVTKVEAVRRTFVWTLHLAVINYTNLV